MKDAPILTADPPDARPREFVRWRRDRWMFEAGGPVILMYHKVAVPPAATNLAALYISPRGFRRQMDELTDSGLACLSLDETLAAAREGRAGFCLSFDDGFRNVFQHALPALQTRGLRAIQFIVAGQIGGADAWERALGEPVLPLMDDAEIRDWLAAGCEIGSHTLTHPHLTRIAPQEARREIFESKQRLEDRFGQPIRHFCYPYGDCDDRVREWVKEAGYVSACTVGFGVNSAGTGPHELRRVLACDSPLSFERLARHALRLGRGIGK